jgi:hypothetical protein
VPGHYQWDDVRRGDVWVVETWPRLGTHMQTLLTPQLFAEAMSASLSKTYIVAWFNIVPFHNDTVYTYIHVYMYI